MRINPLAGVDFEPDPFEVALAGATTVKEVRAVATRFAKHASPTHPGTGTSQLPHGEWADGMGGTRDARAQRTDLKGIQGRGQPATWKGYSNRKETGAISRDTLRRRIDGIKKHLEAAGFKFPDGLKVEYWTDYDKYWDESGGTGASGQYFAAKERGWGTIGPRIVLNPSLARQLLDDELHGYRVLTHEYIHAAAPKNDREGTMGRETILSEAGAELLSLKFWADTYDLSEFKSYYPQKNTGLKAMVSGSVYTEETLSMIGSAVEEVGWDRERIWGWVRDRWDRWDHSEIDDYANLAGPSAEEIATKEVARTRKHYADLIEKFPQHAEEYTADMNKEIEYYQSRKADSWQLQSRQRFERLVSSARASGVNLDLFPQTTDDSAWDYQILEYKARMSEGKAAPTRKPWIKEDADHQDNVARSILFWLLND